MTSLPAGLVARPLGETDLDAVVTMVNTCELHDTGEVMLEQADPSRMAAKFDPSADWIEVFDAIASSARAPRATTSPGADVHPDARGQGGVLGCGRGRRSARGRPGRRASCR